LHKVCCCGFEITDQYGIFVPFLDQNVHDFFLRNVLGHVGGHQGLFTFNLISEHGGTSIIGLKFGDVLSGGHFL
jgi:hypothetical protein